MTISGLTARSGGRLSRRCQAKGARPPTVGRARGGLPTKVHLATEGRGRPGRCLVTAGPRHASMQALALLSGLSARSMIADKASESQELLACSERQGAMPVIPPRTGRRAPRPSAAPLSKHRNWIARSVTKLQPCRRLTPRSDRKTTHFLAF